MIECTRTERKFKIDFLENKASNEKFLFYIFDLFFRVESPPFRLYHQLPTTLYNYSNINSMCKFSVPILLFRLLRSKILNNLRLRKTYIQQPRILCVFMARVSVQWQYVGGLDCRSKRVKSHWCWYFRPKWNYVLGINYETLYFVNV